jgi:chromosome segregation ATPase
MFSSFFVEGGSAQAGWTSYPPLTERTFLPGHGTDLWILGVQILGISSVGGAINFLVTTMTMRAPGMTLARMPIFVWMIVVTVSEIVDKPDNLREILEKVNAITRPGSSLGDAADDSDLKGALEAIGDNAPGAVADKNAAPAAKSADSGAIAKQAGELKQQVMRLSKEQGDLEVQTDRAKRELESVRTEVAALEGKRTEFEKFEEQARQAKKTLEALRAEAATVEKSVSEIEEQRTLVARERRELAQQMTLLAQEKSATEGSADAAKRVKELEAVVAAERSALDEQKHRNDALSKDLAKQSAALEEERNRVDRDSEKTANAAREAAAKLDEAAALKKEIEAGLAKKAGLDDVAAALAKREAAVKEAQAKLADIEKESSKLAAERKSLEHDSKALAEQSAALEKRAAEAAKLKDDLAKRADELAQERAAAKAEQSAIEKARTELEARERKAGSHEKEPVSRRHCPAVDRRSRVTRHRSGTPAVRQHAAHPRPADCAHRADCAP